MGIVIPCMLQPYGMSYFMDEGMVTPVTRGWTPVARLFIGNVNVAAAWICIRIIRIGAACTVLIVGAEPDGTAGARVRYFLETDIRDFRPCRQSCAYSALLC